MLGKETLRNARLEPARHYLLHSELQLNETAFLLGYTDASSFFRAFQHREGKPPGHWRAQNKHSVKIRRANK
jgi:AraC-like DNA-binding protein